MTAKTFKYPAAVLGLTIAIFLGPSIASAQYGGAASPSPAPSPAQNAPQTKDSGKPAQKVNKAEEAAYKSVLAAQGGDPAMQITIGEDFITKFPMSKYVGGVYGLLTTAYYTTGNTDKMFAAGAKSLELNPDNVDVLALLAMAIPRRVKSNTPDGPQQLQKAEVYAHHAIELIPSLAKPETVDDARTELTQAVQLATSPDPVDYYLLGNADDQASFLNGAIAAYDKCAVTGPLVTQCKAREDAVKKKVAAGTTLSRD